MATLHKIASQQRGYEARKWERQNGNALDYNVFLEYVPNFPNPGYYNLEETDRLDYIRSNSTLHDRKNITSEDLKTHLNYNSEFTSNNNSMIIKRQHFNYHGETTLKEEFGDDIVFNYQNKKQFKILYAMNKIDKMIQIPVKLLSPKFRKGRGSQTDLYKFVESLKKKSNPITYITGCSFIDDIQQTEEINTLLNIQKNQGLVENAESNPIMSINNQNEIVVHYIDRMHTNYKEVVRTKLYNNYTNPSTDQLGIFKHLSNNLSDKYNEVGCSKITKVFHALNQTVPDFGTPDDNINNLHMSLLPSLGKVSKQKLEITKKTVERHLRGKKTSNLIRGDLKDILETRSTIFGRKEYDGLGLNKCFEYTEEYFKIDVHRNELENMKRTDDPKNIKKWDDDNNVHYELWYYTDTNLNFENKTVLVIIIDKKYSTNDVDNNDTLEPPQKRSRMVCDDVFIESQSDHHFQIESDSDESEPDDSVVSSEHDDDDSSYRPGSSEEDESSSSSSVSFLSDDLEVIAQQRPLDDDTMSSLTETSSIFFPSRLHDPNEEDGI
jgi:hypothetical protein